MKQTSEINFKGKYIYIVYNNSWNAIQNYLKDAFDKHFTCIGDDQDTNNLV